MQPKRVAGLLLAAGICAGAGCRQVSRELRTPAPASTLPRHAPASELLPASAPIGGSDFPALLGENPYAGNAYAASEGQRLFEWYNCSGCHFRGGGGMGPALMDSRWLYGGKPSDIFRTIVDGRPNGMPAWGGRIPEYQVWELVTYVESLDAGKRLAAPPGPREDHLQAGDGQVSR